MVDHDDRGELYCLLKLRNYVHDEEDVDVFEIDDFGWSGETTKIVDGRWRRRGCCCRWDQVGGDLEGDVSTLSSMMVISVRYWDHKTSS